MKKIIYLASVLMLLSSCEKGYEPISSNPGDNNPGSVVSGTVVSTKSLLSVNLSTDKACYKPGEVVTFTADYKPSTKVIIRYRNLHDVLKEEEMVGKTWQWTPPTTDYTGYMVDLYQKTGDNEETIVGTIAVDVSSDWSKYPRYGFVAAFDKDKTDDVIEAEMAELSRYHINGVQFQDWHYKHHWPLGGTRDNLMSVYKDIANRDIYTSVLKKYISTQHSYGMKSIFYNLCYGALDDDGAATDGVKPQWYVFQDAAHRTKDYHDLLSIGWKSNIYLLDPSNTEWQAYLAQRNDDVYHNFEFDGYQIDQLGNRGTRYNYNGQIVDWGFAFSSFIKAMKKVHPSKSLIMNSVANYYSEQIAGSGSIDFCYNELWSGEDKFADLRSTIISNYLASGNSQRTVFAAYMNYDYSKDHDGGFFNNAGVILTDAVMFALGGSHLELGGDHMLGNEYFPNTHLKMNGALKTSMVRYYDFMTAYENVLRGDNMSEINLQLSCLTGQRIEAWNAQNAPKMGSIMSYVRQAGTRKVISLINFVNANSMSWRDLNADMPTPSTYSNIGLNINCPDKVNKVWVASPDFNGGVAQELKFSQNNGVLSISIPKLKYWTMLVIE